MAAPIVFYDFVFSDSVHTPDFFHLSFAVSAFAKLWLYLWGFYLLLLAAFSYLLDNTTRQSQQALTIAFSAGLVLVAVTIVNATTPVVALGTLLLSAIIPPLLYKTTLTGMSRPSASPNGFRIMTSVIAFFPVAAAYYWTVNYSEQSFEAGNIVRWIGFATLIASTLPLLSIPRRTFSSWLSMAALLGTAYWLVFVAPDSKPEPMPVGGTISGPRLVVIVSIDTLRADALSCYEPRAGSTPNIDKLASDGYVFRETYSPASWTIPSMISIFNGFSPLIHGASLPIEEAQLPTMAEIFRGSGYNTIGIFGNPVLTNKRALFPNQDLAAQVDPYRGFRTLRLLSTQTFGETIAGRFSGSSTANPLSNTLSVAEIATGVIENLEDEPSFLWFHFHDPHWPYSPPMDLVQAPSSYAERIGPAFLFGQDTRLGTKILTTPERKWTRALYQGEVGYIDRAVGSIFDVLREVGRYDESLIVLTSDHGEEFWEHGRYGHGHSLHRESVMVPLIIKPPHTKGGMVIDRPVENRALLPTLLDIAEVPHEKQMAWAPSLAPLMRGDKAAGPETPIITSGVELFENEAAVRVGNLRYIRRLESYDEWLFNLETDPGETRSILYEQPEDAARMRRILDEEIQKSNLIRESYGLSSKPVDPFDEDTLKRLKSLGYL